MKWDSVWQMTGNKYCQGSIYVLWGKVSKDSHHCCHVHIPTQNWIYIVCSRLCYSLLLLSHFSTSHMGHGTSSTTVMTILAMYLLDPGMPIQYVTRETEPKLPWTGLKEQPLNDLLLTIWEKLKALPCYNSVREIMRIPDNKYKSRHTELFKTSKLKRNVEKCFDRKN